MKLNGKTVNARYSKEVKFDRSPDEPIVFKIQSVMDRELFTKLCPEPEAGSIIQNGVSGPDLEDKGYLEKREAWYLKHTEFTVIQSIVDVAWDTVVADDPSTWNNWGTDMESAGFTSAEINRLQGAIFTVNGLTTQAILDAEKNS